jgi:protein tyrosine/serine phosphatase
MHLPVGFSRALAVGVLATGLVATLEAQGAASRGRSAGGTAVATAAVDIDNFGQVSPGYYRGAQPDGRDYADLAALGIKTVINLTSDDAQPDEPALVGRAGMKYIALPMTTHVPPTGEQLSRFLDIVNHPANQPVYVHCVGGKHRTGVMTAVYRMTRDSWTPDQAYDEMKDYNFGSSMLHPEFKKFVYGYRVPEPVLAETVADARE